VYTTDSCYLVVATGDENTRMTDSGDNSSSLPKRRCTEAFSSSSSMNSSCTSSSSSDERCSVPSSSRTSPLTPASVVDRCQPLSFFLTKVEGIDSKFNHSQALGIKGKISPWLYSIDDILINNFIYHYTRNSNVVIKGQTNKVSLDIL